MNYIQILYLCILKQHRVKWWLCSDSCELHSNLVSLHSETTSAQQERGGILLWITFKSCIFAFWNNSDTSEFDLELVVNYIQILYLCILKQLKQFRCFLLKVVNYIQILYLCILKQPTIRHSSAVGCCELHSNLVSLHSETTMDCWSWSKIGLWITFKSCIFAFWNNTMLPAVLSLQVVNYIQILYLCILKQRDTKKGSKGQSCELHSNLVSLHSETTILVII